MMVKKFIIRFFISIGAFLCLYIGFLYFSYMDKKITTGTGYGLKIGSSKKDAYDIIIKNYGENIWRYSIYKSRYQDQKKEYIDTFNFSLSQLGYEDLDEYTGWRFFLEESHWNYLYLEFQDGKLATIHRHRQYYELP